MFETDNGKEFWEDKEFSFNQNRNCEYFPCHKTDDPDNFNCLFCYCPLYALADKCGGNCRFLEDGTKDCSYCMVPHTRKSYGRIIAKFEEISELVKKQMK